MSSRAVSARGAKSPTNSEAEAVHRSFKINRVDPHPKRKVLILYGEVKVSIIGVGAMTLHDSIAEDTREFRKVIRLDSFNESSKLNEIVDEILVECPYIVEQEVIDLLFTTIDYIQDRNYDTNGIVVNGRGKSAAYARGPQDDDGDDEDDDEFSSRSTIPTIFDDEDMTTAIDSGDAKEISMNDLETYIELLYEELQEKAKGAHCISKLVTTPENLLIIFNHESATNALFRTLREDYKKSMDLTTNILRIVEHFAEYKDFHQHLLSHKISSLVFEIIEYELDTYAQWKLEIFTRQADLSESIAHNSQRGSASGSKSGGDNSLSQLSTKQIKAQMQLDKIQLRFDELATKQDNLLIVALKILKYLRVSIPVEELYKKDLVKLLVTCLDHKNSALLTVVIDFLAILSVFQECKNQILKSGVIDTVHPYLVTSIEAVGDYISNRSGSGHNYHEYEAQMKSKMTSMNNSLVVLLYNLSFDTKSRLKMVKYGILQRTAQLFDNGDKMLQQKCILLLYNFSMDRKNRPKFAATNVVYKILMEIESTTEDNPMNLYFIAILLNLATSKRCSQIIFKNRGLPLLVGWAFKTENHLTMKIVRKLAEHDQAMLSVGSGPGGGSQAKNEFVQYISDIANAITNVSSTEFIIECIGTLGNLNIPELDFKKLLQQCQLLGWIKTVMMKPLPVRTSLRKVGEPRAVDETLFIEIAIFLATCVEDVECARFILQDELTSCLLALCENSMRIDIDVQTQILYVLYKMCRHKPLLQAVVTSSKIPEVMIKLLSSDHTQLREMSESILDLIGEYNSEWSTKVKQEKFTAHNHHWLEMVSRSPEADDITSGRPLQLKRPSSAMRRAPSATGHRPEQGTASGRQGSSRISPRGGGVRDSSSDTPTIRSETTTSDDEDSGDDDIDFEEDDEQVSKQNWQNQQKNRGGVTGQSQLTGGAGALSDSLETKNIFERFKHQFQQERDAREMNEYYGSGGMLSDPENDLYYNDDDDDGASDGFSSHRENTKAHGTNSNDSDYREDE